MLGPFVGPLGASPGSAANPGVNFALYAPNATSVTLCLRDWQDAPVMETLMHRSGDVWHAFVAGLPQVGGWASRLPGAAFYCRLPLRQAHEGERRRLTRCR